MSAAPGGDEHLGTGAVDLVVLDQAPAAMLGRIVQSRRVITDKDPLLLRRPSGR